MALNTLHESAQVAQRLAVEARARGNQLVAQRLEERAAEKMHHVEVLRRLLVNGTGDAAAADLQAAEGD